MDRSLLRPRPSLDPPALIGRTLGSFDPIDFSRSSRGRRHAAAMLVVALLVVLAFKVFPLQHVTLVAGDQTVQVQSTFGGQRQALDAAALALAPGDRLFVARTGDQAAVSVQRAVAVVVVADGERLEVRTRARTIAGALALADVAVGAGDRVYVDGLRTAPGEQLDRSAAGSVSAASTAQPLRIKVVRALPATPSVQTGAPQFAASPDSSPPPAIEAVSAAPTLSVLADPFAWRPRESSLPPDMEALSQAVAALPEQRSITVTIGDRAETLRTDVNTVEAVLALLEVELGEHDRLSHGLEERVTEGMAITVVLVEKVIEEYIEYIPARVYRRDDHTLAPGEERTVEGTPGEVRVWEQVTYENDVEVSRESHSAVVLSEPVAGEHLRGPVAGDGVSPVVVDDYDGPYTQKIRVWATWYNATHGEKSPNHPAYGITYSGIHLEYGICAVDPDFIPLHTRFYVPGYGECLAADIGGLIDGYDVDLGYPEGHPPQPWHTGYVHIYILD